MLKKLKYLFWVLRNYYLDVYQLYFKFSYIIINVSIIASSQLYLLFNVNKKNLMYKKKCSLLFIIRNSPSEALTHLTRSLSSTLKF